MLGIIIGIAAIITIVSTIQGTNEQIKENLIGAGNNVVTVNLNQSGYSYDMSWNAIPDGVRVITEETRQELKNIPRRGRSIAVQLPGKFRVRVLSEHGTSTARPTALICTICRFTAIRSSPAGASPRRIMTISRKVALVDANTVSTLFGGETPWAKSLEVKGDVFTVVGVVALSKEFTPHH